MIRANSRANYMPPELKKVAVVDREPAEAAVVMPTKIECHYCGYEPPAGRKGRICPKCGGSSWEPVAPEETIDSDASSAIDFFRTRDRWEDADGNDVDDGEVSTGVADDFDATATLVAGAVGARMRFHVGCRAQQVYVAAWVAGERIRVVPMRRVGAREWDLTIPLDEGRQEFIYLVDDGHDLIECRASAAS
jgi:hypothetical protein